MPLASSIRFCHPMKRHILLFISIVFMSMIYKECQGQSPEISLREFASGQIKKGVRSIGMGGNGATWGNYSLVWRDSCTALIDGGASSYPNNNIFGFTAVGITTPHLWKGLTIYAIALSQTADNIITTLKSPGLGTEPVQVNGDGANQAVFIKAAMPLGKGFSIGTLISYERSQFDAVAEKGSGNWIRYQTNWRPSGGFGITWQPCKQILVGFRGLFNNDWETRIDNSGTAEGLNLTNEYRLGISIGLWKGALIDLGGNARFRSNQINKTNQENNEPNIGIEQNLLKHHLAIRAGLDESSPTAGFSIRFKPIVVDVAYVHNLGQARFGDLFGTNSDSFLLTLVYKYDTNRK
jgi:hypothetical protein